MLPFFFNLVVNQTITAKNCPSFMVIIPHYNLTMSVNPISTWLKVRLFLIHSASCLVTLNYIATSMPTVLCLNENMLTRLIIFASKKSAGGPGLIPAQSFLRGFFACRKHVSSTTEFPKVSNFPQVYVTSPASSGAFPPVRGSETGFVNGHSTLPPANLFRFGPTVGYPLGHRPDFIRCPEINRTIRKPKSITHKFFVLRHIHLSGKSPQLQGISHSCVLFIARLHNGILTQPVHKRQEKHQSRCCQNQKPHLTAVIPFVSIQKVSPNLGLLTSCRRTNMPRRSKASTIFFPFAISNI
jgi:hypothetical protein